MQLFDKKRLIILLTSIVLITLGFICMKLETAEHGFGPLALTVAPILIVAGFVVGIASIFHGTFTKGWIKAQLLFIVAGWLIFIITLVIYSLTMEETSSLWDCSEFIASAYKLQVPHPPGAPLFLMLGRLFSLVAGGDSLRVAYWINMVSVTSSAFAVMFTFWSIVMLAQKASPKSTNFSVIIAGFVGALTIAFADSFWFSAVEAETYAMATLFLIVCFWAILKWEKSKSEAKGKFWLIFIFYALGLSVGVHPMALLVLPALAIIIAFKERKFSWTMLVLAIIIGGSGILFLNHVILFGLPEAMKFSDIFAVNILGMPFYSGAIIFIFLFFVLGYYGYQWSIKRRHKIVSISLIGLLYFLIGYSSYFMIIIRSQANPSIDEHNPENLTSLTSYLKRESYGSRPFLFGPNYTSVIKSYEKGSPVYTEKNGKYEITDYKTKYVYARQDESIFPRMYSNQEPHVKSYQEWTGIKSGQSPGFMDRLNFMFTYQFGHMYVRYLLFNFSGRASDIQHAEWLGPIDLFDDGSGSHLKNKARNNYLMLPFILGVVGMVFQSRKDKKGFWSVMMFFLFLGLIVVFYLNSPPNEPRERDYIYVGSYLAFSMWCGIGTLAVFNFLNSIRIENAWIKNAGIIAIIVPLVMLIEGFDDHNRSGRTIQVDHARNTLTSCAPNAILFTGGDNDTFPLWYVQEVEGFRTDVRVIVLSYFNGDWYIDQMKRKVYESHPLPFSLNKVNYRQGGMNDALPYVENSQIKGSIDLNRYLELVRKESRALQVNMSGGTIYNSIPSKSFYLDIDQETVLKSGIIPHNYHQYVPDRLKISWKGAYLEKSALMTLDLIATNNWERPIYFNMTSLNTIALEMKHMVLQEGQVYRLLPIEIDHGNAVNTEIMYTNLMDKWQFHDLDNEKIYYNHEDYQLRILQPTKSAYNTLASALLNEGKREKAKKVVDFLYMNFIKTNIDLDISLLATTKLLFELEEEGKAMTLTDRLMKNANFQLASLEQQEKVNSREGQIQLYIIRQLSELVREYGHNDLSKKCSDLFAQYVNFQ